MASSIEHISEQIFKIIKGFGHDIVLFTESGKKVVDPSEARRFYAKDIQMMVNFVADESSNEIVVNLSKDTEPKDIAAMLKGLRNLANRYIIEYTVKTFGKSIGPKDFAYMAKNKVEEAAKPLGGKFKVGQRVLPSKSSSNVMTITGFDRVEYMGRMKTFADGKDDKGRTMRRPLNTLIPVDESVRNSFEKESTYK